MRRRWAWRRKGSARSTTALRDNLHEKWEGMQASLGFKAAGDVSKTDHQLLNETKDGEGEAKPAAASPAINPADVAGKAPEEIHQKAPEAHLPVSLKQ